MLRRWGGIRLHVLYLNGCRHLLLVNVIEHECLHVVVPRRVQHRLLMMMLLLLLEMLIVRVGVHVMLMGAFLWAISLRELLHSEIMWGRSGKLFSALHWRVFPVYSHGTAVR